MNMKKNQLYIATTILAFVTITSCSNANSSDQDSKDSLGTFEKKETNKDGNATIPEMPGWEQVSDLGFMFAEWVDDNGIMTTIDVDVLNPENGISWSEKLDSDENGTIKESAKVTICSSCSEANGEGYMIVHWKSNNLTLCYQYKMFRKGNEAQMLLSLQGQDVIRVFKRAL